MIVLIILLSIVSVHGHGYMVQPLARQRYCYQHQDYYWPINGDGIKDEACRAAFTHVALRSNEVSAQYMFNQYTEYAANHLIQHTLCGAGANDSNAPFGDKSGVDLPLQSWHTTLLTHGPNELIFCPTAVHEPSYFEVYITQPKYNYSEPITWNNLMLIYKQGSVLTKKKVDNCHSDLVYTMVVDIPYRDNKFVLFTRWQREDIMGEGFYNCADVQLTQNDEF
ncbi:GP37 [Epinotia aporema granulovirus]|uniref:Gp37 n=1 Tax=Epinotia aporema granulovirus TaxID=166056 RepID=K4EQS7_9BBAC|nr:GP37 [Epinotia aporema granulovirus]AER41456.1 GP37 [Epinotia aporema granulovirus]AGE84009.1 gp37 [Epinotia aporema granulovirus]